MNIFATHACPRKSARYLDDKRVVKMILESTQMLSTAIITLAPKRITTMKLCRPGKKPKAVYFIDGFQLYAPTHVNHPCNVWVRASQRHYVWLLEHVEALCVEYRYRYGRTHASERIIKGLRERRFLVPQWGFRGFQNSARHKGKGIDFSELIDVNEAYRCYLDERFKTDKLKAVCTWNL